MCDLAVPLGIAVEIGVKQIQLHAAHIYAPYVGVDNASGVRHFEQHRLSVLTENSLDGELIEVLRLVVGDLLSVDR